jgi:hypothetical protein
MSLNAATIEILIGKGLSASDILDVARATEVKKDATNAERQARHRARKRNAVTVTVAPPIEDILTPEVSPDDAEASSAPRGRPTKTMIPVDWSPCPVADLSPKARACAEQWSADAYAAQAEEFAGYWRSARRKMADWPATWANRVLHQHAKVMRDAKFGVSYGQAAKVVQLDPQRQAETLESTAAVYDKQGRDREAEDLRRKAARIRGPTAIGKLIQLGAP